MMIRVMGLRAALLAAAALALYGCSNGRLTEPPESATEQLLISTAVDHAVAALDVRLPPGTKAFVDPAYVDLAPADHVRYPKYLLGGLRDQLLRGGVRLVEKREAADVVVEPRSGAQSIDHDSFLIGMPSFAAPIRSPAR